MTDERELELAENLAVVRDRLSAACLAAGRKPDEVSLIVVTKTYPAADVRRLARLGVTDVGENRDQEAAPKAAEVVQLGVRVRWHFVGQLQRNKCRSVVRYADMVHSVDSVRLATALAAAAQSRDLPLDTLVQVSLDGDASRGGAVEDQAEPDSALDRVLDCVAAAEGLSLRGLMAVAPVGWQPDRAFAKLAAIATSVRANYPQAVLMSAGMSGDVEQAIQHGATHVRLGSAVLGNRASLM